MNKMVFRTGLFLALFAVSACVTVNIYFPAAKAEKTAEEIVDDVYGSDGQEPQSLLIRRMLAVIGPATAHAQDATTVSNSAIRGLKNQIASNHKRLAPFYNKGAVGITNNGYLAVRDTSALNLKQVGTVKQLVQRDNNARSKLYQEVAKALNVPTQTKKVQKVFADMWRSKARKGWWVQGDSGSWGRK